jgi:ApaG protein
VADLVTATKSAISVMIAGKFSQGPRMYRALTRDIEVLVEPYYLEEQSDPDDSRYVWGYRIVISNHSAKTVRLTHRYWHITDQNGSTYEYSSGCPLDTPSGMMYGTYRMETDDGESFDVEIPAFSLDSPGMVRTLN